MLLSIITCIFIGIKQLIKRIKNTNCQLFSCEQFISKQYTCIEISIALQEVCPSISIFFFYFWRKEEMCLFISDPQNTSFSSFTETWVSFLSILFSGIRTTTTLAPMYFRFNATSRCNAFFITIFSQSTLCAAIVSDCRRRQKLAIKEQSEITS